MELSPFLTPALRNFAELGTPPDTLIQASESFEWASVTLGDSQHCRIYDATQTRLQQTATAVLALIGSPKAAAQIIERRPTSLKTAHLDRSSEPGEFLKTFTQVVRPEWTQDIGLLVEQWNAYTDLPGSACYFPVLTAESANGTDSLLTPGYLRSVSLSFFRRTQGADKISVILRDVDGSLSSESLSAPIQAARQLLAVESPKILSSGFEGAFTFSRADLLHSGKSANLALAALYLCEAQQFSECRSQSWIKRGVVLSGDIDASGTLQNIDHSGIKGKTEASFFSPASVLVLPRTQVEIAKDSLVVLSAKYPNRHLQIIGVDSLSDLFSDRRLVTVKRRSLPAFVAYKTWNRRSSVIPSFLLICLIAAVVWVRFFSTDMHPETIGFSSTGMDIGNADGDIIGHIPLKPDQMVSIESKNPRLVAIGDLDGDGFKDVVWARNSTSENENLGIIVVWNGATRETIRNIPLEFKLEYTGDPSISHGRMNATKISLTDVDGDGRTEFFVAVRHAKFYPSLLLEYDPSTFRVIQRYDHPGSIEDFFVVDLDGNGTKEIIFGGVNNAFNAAVIGVLKAGDFSGFAPAERYYVAATPPTLNEIAYIKFLDSPLRSYSPNSYPFVQSFVIHLEDSLFTARISDSRYTTPVASGNAALLFEFNFDLSLNSVGTSDPYDSLWKQALAAGYVDGPLTRQDKIDMMNMPQIRKDGAWVPLLDSRQDFDSNTGRIYSRVIESTNF